MENICKYFDCKESDIDTFDVFDVFNNNQIKGYICKINDHRYGALLITHVNNLETKPQLIYCTPKLHYPFGTNSKGERIYHFPKNVSQILCYEKWDGTNIAMYRYFDSDGNVFVTYKTRLTAVVRNGKFGKFETLLKEIIESYNTGIEEFKRYVISTGNTIAFELVGFRNLILIKYPFNLDMKFLFMVDNNGNVFPPDAFDLYKFNIMKTYALSIELSDLEAIYNNCRNYSENMNKKVKIGDDTYIEGKEGDVMYVCSEGKWYLYKVKPPSVETIHWSGNSIPIDRIIPTIKNALESCDELTVDYVRKLLAEEFSHQQLDNSMNKITRLVNETLECLRLDESVKIAYNNLGVKWETVGKQVIMRKMSIIFENKNMNKVYSSLVRLGIARI